MIFKEYELRDIIGSMGIEAYLKEKGYRYIQVCSKDKKLYLIEDKLKLKPMLVIEDILKQEYNVDDAILNNVIDMLIGVYESEESVNIKDLVIKDRAVVDVLLQNEILMYDYHNYNVQIRYSLLAKILEV